MREKREIRVWTHPAIQGGEPMLWSAGCRVIHLLRRIDAGDSVAEVARDFVVDPAALELLLDLRAVFRDQQEEAPR